MTGKEIIDKHNELVEDINKVCRDIKCLLAKSRGLFNSCPENLDTVGKVIEEAEKSNEISLKALAVVLREMDEKYTKLVNSEYAVIKGDSGEDK